MRAFVNKIVQKRLRIGSAAPDFTASTTKGTLRFHEYIGDSWAVFFSHPEDRSPVCTTEVTYSRKLIVLTLVRCVCSSSTRVCSTEYQAYRIEYGFYSPTHDLDPRSQ